MNWGNKGFTMVELVIAVFLATIVTGAAMGLYITQHKQLVVQDEVSDMQASIRAAMAELATHVRMAGYKVPEGVPPVVARNTNPDTIIIMYDSDIIDGVRIEWPMPQPSAELRCDGHDLSALHDGDWVFIYDPILKSGEFFQITNVQYASSHIQHNTMNLSHCYPVGSTLMRMNQFKYYIDQSNRDHPNLMVQIPGSAPQIYAENITGLNFRYLLSSGTMVDVPALPRMVREVLITVNARTNVGDNEFQTQFRTRTLDTRVKVRNLAIN